MKTLVAYFSASGVTSGVASKLNGLVGGDLFEIVPEEKYSSEDLDWTNNESRSSIEMNDPDSRPKISSKVEDISKYDRIFIGYPVWWYTFPRIINTFLEEYDFNGKEVIPFCTSGSSGIGSASSDMAKVIPGAKVLEGIRLTSSSTDEEIKAWLETL